MNDRTFYEMISDFIFIDDELEKSDVILVPGGAYPESARAAAALFHRGLAPYILPSGRYAKAAGSFPGDFETEWEYLSDILHQEGVPTEAILKEDQATFTFENAVFSKQVLIDQGIFVSRAILCCQAFHARRSLMYYRQQFPDIDIRVHSVITKGITKDNWFLDQNKTDIVLGEVERIGAQFHCVLPLGEHRRGYDTTHCIRH